MLRFAQPAASRLNLELLSHVEPAQDNIAVLHYVFFSFQADDSFFSGRSKGAALQQVFVIHDLCTDESTLEVGVDLAGCRRSLSSLLYGPGSGLFLSRCKEAHQSEQTVTCADQFVQTRLCQSQVFQEHLLLVIIQLRDLFFDLSADYKDF